MSQGNMLIGGLLGAFVFASASYADLIQSTPFELSINGTGFGNVSSLITLQTANGQSTTEAGCIGFNNSTTNCGITQVGKIKNTSTTEPLPGSVTSASDLRFVFNASQPQGGSITIDQLQVTFYGSGGTVLETATFASTPLVLTSTLPGTGKSGFVFQLNASEATALNLSAVTQIGAGFSASGASGGQDTVFVATTGPSSVPEPATYGMLGVGFIGFACLLRRKTTSAA